MLELKQLSTGYGLVQVLNGVSMKVPEGSVVTLLGANGAGKSTMLNSIAGLIKPWSGQILLDGKDITGIAPHRLVRLGQSLVAENRELFGQMSVRDNLLLGSFTRQSPEEKRLSFDLVFEIFPRLAERSQQLASTLSGGEQQMLAIGRALMAKPSMLLLDEPSLGIAPILVREIFERVRYINSLGVSILVVEQNAAIALDVASYGYVVENGRVVAEGTSESLKIDTRIQDAYLGRTEPAEAMA